MRLAAGRRLGNYEVIGALGAGGMGEVYEARDLRLGRTRSVRTVGLHSVCDTVRMKSVADQLRRDIVERVRAMTVSQRIALALSLGEADLDLYMRTTGKSREDALRELSARRRLGRVASRAASPER